MVLYSKPHLPCHVQYVGSLKLEKCAVISAANRWELLLSPADGQTAECWLMLGWEEGMWGTGQSHSPNMEAKGSCSSLWKCRGDLLVWTWAGRVETSLHMLSWSQSPFWRSMSWGQGCWDIISAAREDKSLEACTGLAEIPGEKAASRENRVCYWHEGTNWMASGGHGQDLCGRRNPLFHPYSMGWNRQGVIYMYIPECLRVYLHKTKSSQTETAQCCHWRR